MEEFYPGSLVLVDIHTMFSLELLSYVLSESQIDLQTSEIGD